MKKSTLVRDVLRAFTYHGPVWMEGRDFNALNYGGEYSKIYGNRRRIGISGKNISYHSTTSEDTFPNDVFFQKREPYMAMTEATHVGELEHMDIDITLDKLIDILKGADMRFEE